MVERYAGSVALFVTRLIRADSVSNDTILVMCEDAHGCATLRSYLSSLDDVGGEAEHAGRPLLEQRLDNYFVWKTALGKLSRQTRGRGRGRGGGSSRGGRGGGRAEDDGHENAALRRKREYKKGDRGGFNKRRRVRGGGSVQVSTGEPASANEALELEVEALAANGSTGVAPTMPADTMPTLFDGEMYDEYFGLCDTSDLVVIRPYGGDEDDRILEELRPKYIVMYDPDPAFVRRVEVYRSLHASLAVRIYFLLYSSSVEEQKYLGGIRREKDAFERLIRERSIMAIPLDVERRPGDNATIRVTTNSARAAGGAEAVKEPSKVRRHCRRRTDAVGHHRLARFSLAAAVDAARGRRRAHPAHADHRRLRPLARPLRRAQELARSDPVVQLGSSLPAMRGHVDPLPDADPAHRV